MEEDRKQALDALEAHFGEITEVMPQIFDSHQFVLALAHQHQHRYIAALATYLDTAFPFRNVHTGIALRLARRPELAIKIGQHDSEDIFGNRGAATVWERA